MKIARELFDFALKPKEKWALKLAAPAVLASANVQALPFGWAGKGKAAASEAGCSGQVLWVLWWAVVQVPSLTSHLLLSLVWFVSVISILSVCQHPTPSTALYYWIVPPH